MGQGRNKFPQEGWEHVSVVEEHGHTETFAWAFCINVKNV